MEAKGEQRWAKGSYYQGAYSSVINNIIKYFHKNIISNFCESFGEKEHEFIEAYSRSSIGGHAQFSLT